MRRLTAEEFLDLAVQVVTKWPDATITPNPVEGLSIDVPGYGFVGWIDLRAPGAIVPPKPKEQP